MKYKKASFYYVFLIVVFSFGFLFYVGFGEAKEISFCNGDMPPSRGDWIIDQDSNCANNQIDMSGSIIVKKGITLDLKNSDILFNGRNKNMFIVEEGASLILENSKIDGNHNYAILFEEDSDITMKDNLIKNAGWGGENSKGVQVKTDRIDIDSNDFENNYIGISFYGIDDEIIQNNNFKDNQIDLNIIDSSGNEFFELENLNLVSVEAFSSDSDNVFLNTYVENVNFNCLSGLNCEIGVKWEFDLTVKDTNDNPIEASVRLYDENMDLVFADLAYFGGSITTKEITEKIINPSGIEDHSKYFLEIQGPGFLGFSEWIKVDKKIDRTITLFRQSELNSIKVFAEKDTDVRSNGQGSGREETLKIGDSEKSRAFFTFDLNELPENSQILDAKFYITRVGGSTFGFPREYNINQVYFNFWHEDQLNWEFQLCGENLDYNKFCDVESFEKINIINNRQYNIDLTENIKEIHPKNKRFGFILRDLSEELGVYSTFNSKDADVNNQDEKPYLEIYYINNPNVELLDPLDESVVEDEEVDFSCFIDSNFEVHKVDLYGNFDGEWESFGSEEGDGYNYEFTVDIEDGIYEWNCQVTDLLGNTFFAPENNSLIVDTEIDNPELLEIGIIDFNPYGELTFHSKWLEHGSSISYAYIQEDSSGERLIHEVIPSNNLVFNLDAKTLERNQLIKYRFYVENEDGGTYTEWETVTVPNYWEPQDRYFQSMKNTVDFIYDNLYNSEAEVGSYPIEHQIELTGQEAGTSKIQSNVMFAALQVYSLTKDEKYLDFARNIGDWILTQQFEDGFYLSTGDEPLDSIYEIQTTDRLIFLYELTKDEKYLESLRKELDYGIEERWNYIENHFYHSSTLIGGQPKINYNTLAMKTYAYACYSIDDKYCYYADEILNWLEPQQFQDGSWPFLEGHETSQPERYQQHVTWHIAESIYWLEKSGYYDKAPNNYLEMLKKAFENVDSRSNEGEYYFNSDSPTAGVSINMVSYSLMFSRLASVLGENSDWVWRQYDFTLDAPSSQNLDGSWNEGNILENNQEYSSWATSFTVGMQGLLHSKANYNWDLVNIHDNTYWWDDNPSGNFIFEFGLNENRLLFERKINSINHKEDLKSWNIDLTERGEFPNVQNVLVYEDEELVDFVYTVDKDKIKITSNRKGDWETNKIKEIKYVIEQKLEAKNRINSQKLTIKINEIPEGIYSGEFIFEVPGKFVFDRRIVISNEEGSYEFTDENSEMDFRENKVYLKLDRFIEVKEGMQIIVY